MLSTITTKRNSNNYLKGILQDLVLGGNDNTNTRRKKTMSQSPLPRLEIFDAPTVLNYANKYWDRLDEMNPAVRELVVSTVNEAFAVVNDPTAMPSGAIEASIKKWKDGIVAKVVSGEIALAKKKTKAKKASTQAPNGLKKDGTPKKKPGPKPKSKPADKPEGPTLDYQGNEAA